MGSDDIADSDDRGLTLIEVVVAMTLSTIVGAMALSFFVGSFRSTIQSSETSTTTAQARIVLESWTTLIRLADSPQSPGSSAGRFTQIGPSTLTFYAGLNNRTGSNAVGAPTMVTLSYSGGQLIQTEYQATTTTAPYTYSTTPSSTTIRLGCTVTTGPTACSTPATVTSASFTAYYTHTLCPTANVSVGGLCTIDPAANPSLQDAVAVGISLTIAPQSGGASQSFTSLASVGGSSA